MKAALTSILNLQSFSDTLPKNDLVSRQRLRLFRKATFISIFVFLGFTVQVFVVMPGNYLLLGYMFLLFVITFFNYFILPVHRSSRVAFTILLSTWFVLIHVDTYYSGGIRNSANFYLAVLILTAFMLLGSKGGKIMAIFAVLHLVYFYILSTQTDLVSYQLVGEKPGLIDLYFFLSTTASLLALTFQSGYIEKSKNEIIEDINAGKDLLRKSEERLELKNEELERKNKELEEFAYVASHDLQEPLKTASGLAELLKRQYQGKLDERADQYISFIVESAQRMKKLIRDLLDYSRIGYQGKMGTVDCNEVLSELRADLDKLITDSNASIQYHDLPVLNGYPTEIKLLFLNLIVNAIKFRKPGIEPAINISAKRNGSFWHFAVTDNGIGIETTYFEKIFVIFQRLHTASDFKGSGIGLAHCKKIVELHNGKIWVESIPSRGSTFHFTIYDSL